MLEKGDVNQYKGTLPFHHEDNRALFAQIKQGNIDFSGEEWNGVSSQGNI